MADRTATGRLRRLLALVPYVLTHQGAPMADVAKRFELTEKELVDDLHLLWVCGLPGYSHLELIDVSYDSGDLYIRNADVISSPMRLHQDEALSLLIGLQLLEHLAVSSEEQSAIADLRAKINAAAVESVAQTSERIAIVARAESAVGNTVAEALTRKRRLLIDYVVPSRDEVTQREIDPIAVTNVDGQSYLRAWCRKAEGIRHFRLDRILVAKIVDRPAAPPASDAATELAAFTPSPDAPTARLRIDENARWLIEYLSANVTQDDGERIELMVTIGDADRIISLACQLGGALEIVEPLELRAEVLARVSSTLSLYA
jgi:proteasome accessory factor C